MERTVEQVRPNLENNASKINTLIKQMDKTLDIKAKELVDFKDKHGIKVDTFHLSGICICICFISDNNLLYFRFVERTSLKTKAANRTPNLNQLVFLSTKSPKTRHPFL